MKILNKGFQSISLSFLSVFLLLILASTEIQAQIKPIWLTETRLQIYGPTDTSETKNWLTQIEQWRKIEKTKLAYNDSHYKGKDIQWVRKNFIQTQMMVQERSFYDPINNQYTVDKYLNEITSRYGGINSILIWPTYPNIGIDNRNEFDWIRCMPGGLKGVKKMVEQFHKRGVKVVFPYNPWDIGTRRENENDPYVFAKILKYLNADGINGDVTTGLGQRWRQIFDNAKKGIVIEPELDFGDKYLEYDQMGWAYWDYPFIPAISKQKWVEPRHMIHVCDRWAHNHTNDLQYAFFNGVGFETWENIWGIYNEMTPRAVESIKRISQIDKFFYKVLTAKGWEPHFAMFNYGVFASKWIDTNYALWTIVNRNDFDVEGDQMKVPYQEGVSYFDVWHGQKLNPIMDGDNVILSFEIGPNGYGAILAIKDSSINKVLNVLLSQMNEFAKTKLSDFSNKWNPIPQKIVPIEPTALCDNTPNGMIKIPGARFVMKVSGIEIEGGENPGVDVQMPGEKIARRHHRFSININTFYIDKYPVTNEQFKKFLVSTHYSPIDKINFLKDWVNGNYPKGWGNKPVTWIDIEDARAYAKWAGKRLPHEWEWQYAAQGLDGRLYPWGNSWNSLYVPIPDTGQLLCGPDSVNAHPQGKSPFGVEDMVGNVWQWTDEYQDSHTRAAILRGGSYYQPQGSYWYFPQAYKLNGHGKYLLMSPGENRAGTIGFRCVKDASVLTGKIK